MIKLKHKVISETTVEFECSSAAELFYMFQDVACSWDIEYKVTFGGNVAKEMSDKVKAALLDPKMQKLFLREAKKNFASYIVEKI